MNSSAGRRALSPRPFIAASTARRSRCMRSGAVRRTMNPCAGILDCYPFSKRCSRSRSLSPARMRSCAHSRPLKGRPQLAFGGGTDRPRYDRSEFCVWARAGLVRQVSRLISKNIAFTSESPSLFSRGAVAMASRLLLSLSRNSRSSHGRRRVRRRTQIKRLADHHQLSSRRLGEQSICFVASPGVHSYSA
jgi:ribonuclease P protein component